MNKRILITGASAGIGRALSLLLADKGYDLILVARRENKLRELKSEIQDRCDVRVVTFPCDVSKPDEITRLLDVVDKEGGVYAVVNNAAISYAGLLQDMSDDDWHKIMDTNLNSIFYICRGIIPSMVHNKYGRIINISSMWGESGASMEVAYSTTKGAVNAFTKSLSKELAPSNISVNAVAFGVIDTDMNSNLTYDEKNQLTNDIPMSRMGTPLEAATMIYNILTAPSYLTGQIVTMDGGYL